MRFTAKNWQELGFASNSDAFEALDRDATSFFALLTEAHKSGKLIPLPWKRFLEGLQDEKSARVAVRNCLKSNSGRRGAPPENLDDFISDADRKKIADLQKRLQKLQESALETAKASKAKSDAERRILELAEAAGLKVKLE
jgi:hypothetical protein